MKNAVSRSTEVNIPKRQNESFKQRIIGFVIPVAALSGIFLILMLISHSVLADDHFDEQVLIAVFEDHNEQVNSSMPYGLSWQLIDRAAKIQKLDLVKVATTWQSGINRLRDDRLDLMFAAFRNKEREKWAQFTLPLASDASVLFSAIDSPTSILEEVDFENEVVGVISDSTQENLAREIGFKHIYPARVRKRLYKLLESGRVNYVLLGHSSIALYCKSQKPCVQQVGEPLADNYSRVMALKKGSRSKLIMDKLNAGLQEIYAKKEIRELFLSHGYSEAYYNNWKAKFENELVKSVELQQTH